MGGKRRRVRGRVKGEDRIKVRGLARVLVFTICSRQALHHFEGNFRIPHNKRLKISHTHVRKSKFPSVHPTATEDFPDDIILDWNSLTSKSPFGQLHLPPLKRNQTKPIYILFFSFYEARTNVTTSS